MAYTSVLCHVVQLFARPPFLGTDLLDMMYFSTAFNNFKESQQTKGQITANAALAWLLRRPQEQAYPRPCPLLPHLEQLMLLLPLPELL